MKRDAKKDLRLCARVTLLAHKLGSKEINPSEITEHWINRAVVAEAKVKELEAENEQLHAANDLRLKRLECEDGKLDMKLEDPTGMVQMFTSHMVKMFEDAGGTNYVEWTVTHQETRKTYSLMMQRRDGKTPAEINHELKDKLQRVADWIVKEKQLCPYGAPGYIRPCAGKKYDELNCRQCTIDWVNR